MIAFSICLIVTASPSRISSTHAASHGAGHRRPVNSGKLFVACSCAIASREAVAVDEVVPVGDQVAQRAAVVAERHAAVHAARALLAQLLHGARQQELAVVVRALERIPLRDAVALDLQEAAELAHQAPVLADRVQRPRRVRLRGPCPVLRGAGRQGLFLGELAQHALVVVRHHLHERAASSSSLPLARARARRPASRCAAGALRSSRAARSRRPRRALRSRPCPCCSAWRTSRPRRARRRRRRSCRRRSCARWARARPRARRSCTRSRGRRRPRRPPTRRSCAPRSARPRARGRRPGRRSRRTARCCRRSRSPRP